MKRVANPQAKMRSERRGHGGGGGGGDGLPVAVSAGHMSSSWQQSPGEAGRLPVPVHSVSGARGGEGTLGQLHGAQDPGG